ncbi:MAG TPA: hypothetical protein VGU03_11145 [Frateuria sp.]|uniref:hypothetical protein n=1 Tax=Frateuria sp. TaxID=2211372 RepID=UPI002DF56485|nr:hypothetical protein [Frateuria sp.]
MRELPILFSAPMVRAILDGRKTQTRRVCKDQHLPGHKPSLLECPYGKPGDRLWVREAWRVPVSLDDLSGKRIAEKCLQAGYRSPWCPTQYEADGARTSEKDWREFGPHPSTTAPGRYRHARFMPRWASRITLEVTGVRVERLQAISEADSIAEGLLRDREGWRGAPDLPWFASPLAAYRSLWESINGDGSWDANPWVRVVEFRRIEQEAKAA